MHYRTRFVTASLLVTSNVLQVPKSRAFSIIRSTNHPLLRKQRTIMSSQLTASDLHSPVDRDNRKTDKVSALQFLAIAGIVGPAWATFILPLSIIYQVGKAIGATLLPQSKESNSLTNYDTGYQVNENSIIPRPNRKYDVVILGATGFTGKLAALHLAKTYGVKKNKVRWAIAGRNQKKLDNIKKELANELGLDEILELDTIIVDTSIPETIPNLVRDTRAVVTTAGPFSLYGSPVVEFCAKFGTHYADITGEVDWVKNVMAKWEDTAKKTGAKIVSFCGNDSIPWDLSVYILSQQLKKEKNEDLVSVVCMDEIKTAPSGGTLLTMSLAMDGKLPKPPTDDPMAKTASGILHKEELVEKLPFSVFQCTKPWDGETAYGSPFVMAFANVQIVKWTHALRGGPSMSYSEFQISPDFKTGFVNIVGLVAFFTSLLNPITSYLLKRFALPKPGEGPSMDDMTNKHFLSVFTQGVGTNGTEIESVMYFPRCPGYLETARMLVECGLCLGLEEDKLPVATGGFFSPAFALGDVLLNRLTETGTYFASRIKSQKQAK